MSKVNYSVVIILILTAILCSFIYFINRTFTSYRFENSEVVFKYPIDWFIEVNPDNKSVLNLYESSNRDSIVGNIIATKSDLSIPEYLDQLQTSRYFGSLQPIGSLSPHSTNVSIKYSIIIVNSASNVKDVNGYGFIIKNNRDIYILYLNLDWSLKNILKVEILKLSMITLNPGL